MPAVTYLKDKRNKIESKYHQVTQRIATTYELINQNKVDVVYPYQCGIYQWATKYNMEIISKTRMAHEMNSVSIAVAEYLLDNFDIVKEYCEKIKSSRNSILKALNNLGLNVRGKHGNYILVTFKNEETAKGAVKF